MRPSLGAAALCSPASVSSTDKVVQTDLGRYLPTASAGVRPAPATELAQYGGARLLRGERGLAIGSGAGRLALGAALWAREVVGLDPDPSAIKVARAGARRMRARNARFVVGPAQELPFRDGAFDIVILSWTL